MPAVYVVVIDLLLFFKEQILGKMSINARFVVNSSPYSKS